MGNYEEYTEEGHPIAYFEMSRALCFWIIQGLKFGKQRAFNVIADGLPHDAELYDVRLSNGGSTILFFVSHPSFTAGQKLRPPQLALVEE
jgi:hypothetical protein